MTTKKGTANDDVLAADYNITASDQFFGLAGDDTLNGYSGNDKLDGGDGDDWLDGGVGADTMIGGNGADAYVVDNTGDVLIEKTNPAGQSDSVTSYIENYVLGGKIEALYLGYGSIIKGTGNALNNYMNGNDNANVLLGLSGNDTLDGGVGADTLDGGLGQDEYWVDSSDDFIKETTVSNALNQVDTVYSMTQNYTLSANVENMTLYYLEYGGKGVSAIGNSSANTLMGNEGANNLSGLAGNDSLNGSGGNDSLDGGTGNDTLNGEAGADVMQGGTGNDYYVVDNRGDSIVEAAGDAGDSVESWLQTYTLDNEIENLVLPTDNWNLNFNTQDGEGNGLANRLQGNSFDNKLWGLDGNDTLVGNNGQDTFYGGSGNDILTGHRWNDDVFVFDTALNASSNLDQITNFQGRGDGGGDKIQLHNDIFSAFNTATDVTASMLLVGDNVTAASDNNDYLIYNSATGALFYDADANGTASQPIQFIGLGAGLKLVANDFSVI